MGSSSYITNLAGEITQHMEYLPFGETLVEDHLNSNNSPYKFNAKELDAETGNYYYGARYYDPKWSIWLGVDPLAEMMPSWSSYNYAFSNPIKFTDPTGMAPETDYGLTQSGKVKQIGPTNNKPDRLFKLDENDEIDSTVEPMTVNDKSTLANLKNNSFESTHYEAKSSKSEGTYAISNKHTEIKKLYEWIATHNKNEWFYIKADTPEGKKSSIGTSGFTDSVYVPKSLEDGWGEFTMIHESHSHHGFALYDFRPSSSGPGGGDVGSAARYRENHPNARFSVFSPFYTKANYNKAIEGKYMRGTVPSVPLKKLNHEPSKYIYY